MIRSHLLALCSSIALASLVAAQATNAPKAESSDPAQVGIGTEPVPGRLPGTHRYNVTFRTRGFDLDGLIAARERREDPAVIQAIVRDLEARAEADQAEFRRAIEAIGGAVEIHFWLINACTIDLPDDQLAAVRAMPNVFEVRPDLPTYPLGNSAAPFIRVATDSSHHNADAEHLLGNHGSNVTIAIVDTSADTSLHGANMPHMSFYRNGDRNNHTGPGLDGSRLHGAFAIGSQPANNSHPHGTGVTGIAAGEMWNTAGADRGHASDAGIVVYSICNVAGSCNSSLAIEAAGWQRVAADAATYGTVTGNMSYGSSPDPLDVSQQAIDACTLVADVLPVCAAGNNGASTAGSSACTNGLAVAAIDPTDKTVASFSSRGPLNGDTQRFYPDIAACGVATIMPQFGNESGDYVASGTSMASPQVCGAAGLIKNIRPATNARELKALLLNNTESIETQNPGLNRNAYGLGFLRDDVSCSAARANGVLSSTLNSTTTPNAHSLAVVANQRYAVTLVWNRQVLTSTAWSDLSLTIKNGATVIATSDTPRNLYEKVEFSAPITGNLTVEVAANSLEIANLPYALAFGLSTSNGLATVTRSGTGCISGSASYYELFNAGGFDLAPSAIRMTPQNGGYQVTPISASVVPPSGGGLALSDDSISAPIGLPFTLNFPGGSTTQIRICSNGFIYLNGTGSSRSYVPRVDEALSGGPRLFPGWTDLLPDSGTNTNNVYFNNDAANNRVLITWWNVPEFSSGGPKTFQVVIHSNGVIEYVWQTYSLNSHQGFVGFSPGNNGRDPGSRDLSAALPFFTGADAVPLAQDASRPVLGTTCTLQVSDIPAGSATGWEILGIEAHPPIDLTFAGGPTCFLYVNPSITSLPFSVAGTSASVPLPIPMDLSLQGIALGAQAVTITPGLNAMNAATSNLVVLGLGQF